MNIKGYYINEGYVGFLNNGRRMLFATESEYREYMSECDADGFDRPGH